MQWGWTYGWVTRLDLTVREPTGGAGCAAEARTLSLAPPRNGSPLNQFRPWPLLYDGAVDGYKVHLKATFAGTQVTGNFTATPVGRESCTAGGAFKGTWRTA